jgi:hypothetical protein
MSEQTLGSPPDDRSTGEAIFIETPGLDKLRSGRGSVPQEDLRQQDLQQQDLQQQDLQQQDLQQQDLQQQDLQQQDLQQEDLDNARALAQMARDQLARDIADIEHASAALRRAEPALESWTGRSASAPNPRPLWLLIGVLWVSTALVTVGAVVAIAAFAG